MNQPPLNENLRWFDDASFKSCGFGPGDIHKIRSAFAGIPRHVLLNYGEVLYRFQSGGFLTPHGHLSPWWLPVQAVEEIRRLHRETGLSFEEVVRATAGLAFDFQGKCDFELRARVLVPMYAFVGPFSRERLLAHPYGRRSKDLGLNPELARLPTLSGYLEQLFIPNLKPENLGVTYWKLSVPSGGFSLIT